MKKIEILAPAGSFDSVIAAVRSGADAVYLGEKSFSARSSAKNFDDEELKKATVSIAPKPRVLYVFDLKLIAPQPTMAYPGSIPNTTKTIPPKKSKNGIIT